MADFNADNYKGQYVDKPSSKFPKGENAGRKRLLLDHYTTNAVDGVLTGGADRVLGPKIPASSIVTDAKIYIDGTLGAGGIFDLGYLANSVDAADADAFVTGADGGGQAALQRADATNAGLFKRFSEETQVVLSCTETTVNAGVTITFEIEYVND